MHKANFITGEFGVSYSAVYDVMASVTGDGSLPVIWLTAGTTCTGHAIMRQHARLRVVIAYAGNSDLAFAATGGFA